MRLIDADELKKALGITSEDCSKCGWGSYESCGRGYDFEDACVAIDNAVPVDAVPVRHGHWNGEADDASCSACGRNLLDFFSYTEYCGVYEYPNFCPNCGARMDSKI